MPEAITVSATFSDDTFLGLTAPVPVGQLRSAKEVIRRVAVRVGREDAPR